jgi:hypothetical protein
MPAKFVRAEKREKAANGRQHEFLLVSGIGVKLFYLN